MKKLISLGIGAALLLVSGAPVLAASGCQNSTTGYLSLNNCNTTLSKIKTLLLENRGTVLHNITKNVTSGNNTFNYNTVGSDLSINTGAAEAFVGSGASLNTTSLSLNQTDPTEEFVGGNSITGANSTNNVNVANTKTAVVSVSNDGSVVHNISVNVNSGGNTASYNTVAGGIQTGNATSTTVVETVMNSTTISITQ